MEDYLARIQDHVLMGTHNLSADFTNQQHENDSVGPELKGSKLINKYNDILREYQHQI